MKTGRLLPWGLLVILLFGNICYFTYRWFERYGRASQEISQTLPGLVGGISDAQYVLRNDSVTILSATVSDNITGDQPIELVGLRFNEGITAEAEIDQNTHHLRSISISRKNAKGTDRPLLDIFRRDGAPTFPTSFAVTPIGGDNRGKTLIDDDFDGVPDRTLPK